MNKVGQKIRALRKQQQITLENLAGDRLTKGMLSLIENGKAQPSMESLHYIAERLHVDVAELLNDNRQENLKEIVVRSEQLAAKYDYFFQDETVIAEFYELVEPLLPQLKNRSYEEIRLQDLYYRFKSIQGIEVDDEKYLELVRLYRQVHAYEKILRCYSILCWKYFYRHEYQVAMDYLVMAEQEMDEYAGMIDDLTRLDMYYNLTSVATALYDDEKTQHYLEQLLAISKEKKIYYRMDDVYRVLFILAMNDSNFDKAAYYLEKLKLLGAFSEDYMMKCFAVLCEAHYMNIVEQRYTETLQMMDDLLEDSKSKEGHLETAFFNIERVYALFMLEQYDKALEMSQTIIVPPFIHHPYDLTFFYRLSAIRAMCYAKLGFVEEAKRDILYAVDSMKDYPSSHYKDAVTTFYKEIQDFIKC